MQENDTLTTACLSCGAELTGKYCSQCGEKTVSHHDKRVSHFFGEFIHILTHADSRFLKSLKAIFFRPGELSSKYINGQRKKYATPLSMFVIANLIYLLIMPVDAFNSKLESQGGQMYARTVAGQIREKMTKKGWSESQMSTNYNAKSGKMAKIMLLLLVFFISVPVSILYFGKQRYYFDHVVLSTEMVTYFILSILVVIPYLLYGILYLLHWLFNMSVNIDLNGDIALIFLCSILVTYFAAASRKVYKQKWWLTISKSVVLTYSLIYVVTFYRFVLFQVTMLML